MNSKDLLYFSILSLITVSVWIFFDAYHSYTTSIIPAATQNAIIALDPKIDSAVIESLKRRSQVVISLPVEAIKLASPSGEAATTPAVIKR